MTTPKALAGGPAACVQRAEECAAQLRSTLGKPAPLAYEAEVLAAKVRAFFEERA